MSKFFNFLANIFFPVRYVLVFSCFISFFSIVYLLIFSSIKTQDFYLPPLFLLFLWGGLLFVLCHSFHGELDSDKTAKLLIKEKAGWFCRLKQKLINILFWMYSLIFIGLVLISLHLTLKIITL
ncbi:MAG: hypothetical protein P8I03_13310 [Thalassotalea sp.]|nr:hypothetical protein [Thalassotalea sp.]